MKRIAFFVEGQTEQIFVNRLVRYLLGPKKTTIIQKKIHGGTNVPKEEITLHRAISRAAIYEVLIVNCGSDNRVKSEMMENIVHLSDRDYKYIIGLRDLYPLPLEDANRLYKGLRFLPENFRQVPICFDIVLAVREIETWIMSDTTLYQRINKKFTEEYLLKHVGFNPMEINLIEREHPAQDLDNIMQLIGNSYSKKFNQTAKLIYAIDIHQLIHHVRHKVKGLNILINYIEEFRDLAKEAN